MKPYCPGPRWFQPTGAKHIANVGVANAYPATLAGISSAASLYVDRHASVRVAQQTLIVLMSEVLLVWERGSLPAFGRPHTCPQAGVNVLSIRDAHRFPNTINQLHSWVIHLSPTYDHVFPWDDEAGHYSVLLTDEKLEEIEVAIADQKGLPGDSEQNRANSASVAEAERNYPKSEVKASREVRIPLFFLPIT